MGEQGGKGGRLIILIIPQGLLLLLPFPSHSAFCFKAAAGEASAGAEDVQNPRIVEE